MAPSSARKVTMSSRPKRRMMRPHPTCRPCMRFLSVRPDFCRRLPSDSTSQWTPLPLAICFPSLGRIRDFHPLEHTHAGRTICSGSLIMRAAVFFVSICYISMVLFLSISVIYAKDMSYEDQNIPFLCHCNSVALPD